MLLPAVRAAVIEVGERRDRPLSRGCQLVELALSGIGQLPTVGPVVGLDPLHEIPGQ
ncbi:MAG: hypothetical protein ABSD78_01935 [Acidimicrobiales bacterium]